MAPMTERREGEAYTFRRYEPGDERDFLALFDVVWDERPSEAWFRWRFEENPYLDRVPMFVAEADDGVVGVRPYLPLPMRVGRERVLGLLTVDTMVHPDHRGRGLFTTLTDRSLDVYADGAPAFVFNQPNAASRPGYLSAGFRELDGRTIYYRVQRPSAFFETRLGVSSASALSRLADGVAGGYGRLRAGAAWHTANVTVRRYADVASSALTRVYERSIPHGITAHRDEQFYNWRFASPAWTRRTYVAAEGDEQVAGVLARTRTTAEGIRVTQVADLVPLEGGQEWKRGLAACLEHVVGDATESDVIAVPGRTFPADVAIAYGFLPDDKPPVSSLSSADVALCVRSLQRNDDAAWRLGGVSLCDAENWFLTFAERDTS